MCPQVPGSVGHNNSIEKSKCLSVGALWQALQRGLCCCLVVQSCLTLSATPVMSDSFCNPMDGSPPGSSVHGISQARVLQPVAISSTKGSSWPKGLNPRLLCLLHWQSGCLPLASSAAKSLQSCPTVRPHRRQPTRLPHPWDSPGENTGVGCQFLLQCMKVKSESELTQSCATLSDPMDRSLPGSSIHGIFQARVVEWGAFAFSD